jgi:rhomboid protease GluP
MQIIVINLLFGFMMRGIDNYAHLGGLAGGWLISAALDPLKPERIDHMVIALGCIALSILSVIASLLTPLAIG